MPLSQSAQPDSFLASPASPHLYPAGTYTGPDDNGTAQRTPNFPNRLTLEEPPCWAPPLLPAPKPRVPRPHMWLGPRGCSGSLLGGTGGDLKSWNRRRCGGEEVWYPQIKYSFLLLSPASWSDGSPCRATSALSANSVPLSSCVRYVPLCRYM